MRISYSEVKSTYTYRHRHYTWEAKLEKIIDVHSRLTNRLLGGLPKPISDGTLCNLDQGYHVDVT